MCRGKVGHKRETPPKGGVWLKMLSPAGFMSQR